MTVFEEYKEQLESSFKPLADIMNKTDNEVNTFSELLRQKNDKSQDMFRNSSKYKKLLEDLETSREKVQKYRSYIDNLKQEEVYDADMEYLESELERLADLVAENLKYIESVEHEFM